MNRYSFLKLKKGDKIEVTDECIRTYKNFEHPFEVNGVTRQIIKKNMTVRLSVYECDKLGCLIMDSENIFTEEGWYITQEEIL